MFQINISMSNEPIASEIKSISQRKGIKLRVVAEKSGYTAREFSDMLNGRRLIRGTDIPKIAYALEVTPNQLFGVEEKNIK